MTYEEVREHYVDGCAMCTKLGCDDCEVDMVIEALEKQIPMKPVEKIDVNPVIDEAGAYVDAVVQLNLHCPVCGEWVGIEDYGCDLFCRQCGQRIYFSEVE